MKLTIDSYVQGIKDKDLSILAKAITLVESKKEEHKELAAKVIQKILPLTGNAKRIGISGTPGVGKSTFLEHFGMFLINQKKSLAVLAVDPTSQVSGGSILGDKTRMNLLSSEKDAFIRPSPNGATLGGIAAKTREAMLLCDAFGFDYIFIETVGVGQSEVSVSYIVDMFILLMQPGSGDELQGIKRGILEVSDLVIVTKADGDLKAPAQIAQHDYKKSLEVLQEKNEWQTPVLIASSIEKTGFSDIDSSIGKYFSQYDYAQRDHHFEVWLQELLKEKFARNLAQTDISQSLTKMKKGEVNLLSEVERIYQKVVSHD